MNKKAVFLFGAGAVLDWGGPKTKCKNDKLTILAEYGSDTRKNRVCCLTHLITATGFKDKNGDRITEKIFNLLGRENDEVNFETIINVIEELYAYWATKSAGGNQIRNLYSIFDFDERINELNYLEHTEPNPKTKFYSVSIPGFGEMYVDHFVPETIHPVQKYYELFLNEILGGIQGHISKYSYYTKNHNAIYSEVNNQINTSFAEWMGQFISKGYVIRMYTLNYDRIFKVLLQEKGLDIFEGFDLEGTAIGYEDRLVPNSLRIISDLNTHTHYNLHGCADWEVEELNVSGLPSYQYYLTTAGIIDHPVATIEIEKGKRILLANIITGYQKVQRTAISPFRQMFAAFDIDLHQASELYIIGYSNGDEHINEIIRNARKYNPTLKIVIINPGFDDHKFMFDFLLHWEKPKTWVYETKGADELIAPAYNVKAIKKTFGSFLINTATNID